jgi:hypothetical protein
MADHIPGPYYLDHHTVYGLARNERGHLENSFSAPVQVGWTHGKKTPREQLKATALLFRASPNFYEAAKKAIQWADSPGNYQLYTQSQGQNAWVADLRYAIWLAEGGWICVCDKINEAKTENCRNCGLDKASMGSEE